MADKPSILYKCNPALNYTCGKTKCFLNGGPCTMTKNKEFAVDPNKVTLVLPADDALLKDIPGTRKARRRKKKK